MESALNAESAGDDGLAGPVSDDEFYKDDEDEEATQRPPPAAASPAAPLTHGGARRGSQGAAATGAPPRCCAAARSQPPTISLHAGGVSLALRLCRTLLYMWLLLFAIFAMIALMFALGHGLGPFC